MNRIQKHNLYHIKRNFEKKTGTLLTARIAPDGHQPVTRHRSLRPAVLVTIISALCLLLTAFTWPLFSPLDGDALTLSANYEGNGIVSIQVENRSHKKLEFQPQTKLVKWITNEEVPQLTNDITFDDLTITPHSTETITLDLSRAYDMSLLEQSRVTEWYYLVLTNYNFVFGQEWKCSIYFGTQRPDDQPVDDVLYEIDPEILSQIEEELRFYFEDDYNDIFAGNPLHYAYLQKAQELLLRSGKTIAGMAVPQLFIEPIQDGVMIDETYPSEKQYQLQSLHATVRDVFGKLVGFREDQHVMRLGVYTEDGWELPIMYFASFEKASVSTDGYTFIYGQIVSFAELAEHLVYEDETYCCYDVTHLFYTDLRGYFDEVVASDPEYYENAEKYWQRIQNVYSYYKENLRILSFEEWQDVRPWVKIENDPFYKNLTAEGLCGTVTSNYDMEKIVLDISAQDSKEVYSYTIIPEDPRYYDLSNVPEVSDVLKSLPAGEYHLAVTVWLSGTDIMRCQTVLECILTAGDA